MKRLFKGGSGQRLIDDNVGKTKDASGWLKDGMDSFKLGGGTNFDGGREGRSDGEATCRYLDIRLG